MLPAFGGRDITHKQAIRAMGTVLYFSQGGTEERTQSIVSAL
jgi:hypothetical protein